MLTQVGRVRPAEPAERLAYILRQSSICIELRFMIDHAANKQLDFHIHIKMAALVSKLCHMKDNDVT
jgi:hypothetical protein